MCLLSESIEYPKYVQYKKTAGKKEKVGFLQTLKKEIKDNLIKYIAGTIIIIISGTITAFWDSLGLSIHAGSFETVVKSYGDKNSLELRVYQSNYFIKKVFPNETIKLDPGNYELKIKVDWSAEPILLEQFKVIKGHNTIVDVDLPKRQIAYISGQVMVRGRSLEPCADLIVEALEQKKQTITTDDGRFVLVVEPDLDIRLDVKRHSEVVWRTLVVGVKPGEERNLNITIPHGKIF